MIKGIEIRTLEHDPQQETPGYQLSRDGFHAMRPIGSMDLNTEVSLSKIQGIRKLSFVVNDIQTPYQDLKEAGVTFDFDLTEQKSMAFDRYFMIQDNYGNSIQLVQSER